MIGLKPVIVKKRRKVEFYTHVGATMPQGRSSFCRIWHYTERSCPSMHIESFFGFFTSGRHSRGHYGYLPKVLILSVTDNDQQYSRMQLRKVKQAFLLVQPAFLLNSTFRNCISLFPRPV